MLAIVLALLIVTNGVTYYLVKRQANKTTQDAHQLADQAQEQLETFKAENQSLKQEAADLRYKNRELEKDLASMKR